ncbi:hypothetical protein TNCV_279161 [Trichonephila clavipes]|nr:hypothetical protein TNCV_279161 [Trichonephila clavipes]
MRRACLTKYYLSQCLDPVNDLDWVIYHPELPVYTDGSKDDYYRSGSGIYIKSQDHILRIQRRNSDSCSVFRTGLACSHPPMSRAHQAGFSRRSLGGVGFFESVRCHGPGLALLTNGSVQQQHMVPK